MSEIILHHYWTSPFSETVRMALGAKRLAWRSVEQPVIMPKPHLTPLTGGYRRIPVMQIGADLYCDSQLILRELERRFPNPALVQPGEAGVGWAVRAWVERSFFQTSVGLIFGAIADSVPEAFLKDREALSGRAFDTAAMKAAAPLLKGQWRAQAEWIEAQLSVGGPFLAGAAVGLSDVAAAMPFWWVRAALGDAAAPLTAGLTHVEAWMARIRALGHGTHTPMAPEEAVGVARDTQPEAARASSSEIQGLSAGQNAIVMADDYGRDPIAGLVHFVDAQEIAITRESPETGTVCVHFPRAGYVARAA
ncbi:MAG: glutathione S-transferase family protein [Hyphomonadaceae bacterium]